MRETNDAMTTGQLSKLAGMTVRTIRYYDQIGLLKPSRVDPAKGRLYRRDDAAKLQHIRILKAIGLSLDEIRQATAGGESWAGVLAETLLRKREDVASAYAHLRFVVRAVNEAIALLERRESGPEWTALGETIAALEREAAELLQYRTPEKLQSRLGLYDRFGANAPNWHEWFFDRLLQLEGRGELRVLEVGCGDGSLWRRNLDRLPEAWRATLTDVSFGMAEEAKKRIRDPRVKLLAADAQELPFHDGSFDVVIANHMLYHVPDVRRTLAELRRVLADGGALYASAMSGRHLAELESLAASFDPDIRVLDPAIERFSLDNGGGLLAPLFTGVVMHRLTDELQADDIEPLVAYMTSTPMNAKDALVGKRLERFRRYLAAKLEERGTIAITRDLGFFRAAKRSDN